jgi:hypothetical protein
VSEGEARAGRRGNGLSAAAYSLLAACSPQVADAVLAALAGEGIAAYAVPHAGDVGGYLEVHPPTAPTARVWVDASAVDRARVVLATLLPEERDEEAAWQEIVSALRRDGAGGPPPWPSAEDLPAAARRLPPPERLPAPEPPAAPGEADHFEPPPPPPLPRVRGATAYGVAAVVGGALVLVVPTIAGDPVGSELSILAVLAILGGFATLVARMREGPPTDSGPDDGAVV